MIEFAIGLVIGVAAGMWGYRYMLRHDPDALEAIAAKIREAKRQL